MLMNTIGENVIWPGMVVCVCVVQLCLYNWNMAAIEFRSRLRGGKRETELKFLVAVAEILRCTQYHYILSSKQRTTKATHA